MKKHNGKFFAGIGARSTPDKYLQIMGNISALFTREGFMLRSGGADGADKAFEEVASLSQIMRPEHATSEALKMAELYHPHWKVCSPFARQLLARNCQIILGEDLNAPVSFVVCWTPGGKIFGGTGHSIRIAQANNIKVYNLAIEEEYHALRELFKAHISKNSI